MSAVETNAQVAQRGIPARIVAAHVLVLLAAIACWVLALRGARLDSIAGLGLLDALPFTYYVAVGLLTAGFAAAVTADVARARFALLYVLTLVVVLHGTTAVLYDEPRYAWVYKHLGVIDLIAQHGAAARSLDIYANWPAFFALNAWFSSATGIAAIDFAPWAQVFFNVLYVAALVFVLRGLTRDAALIWTSVWFFLLGNWIGQDYLAPQAFAFLMFLTLAGLYLRCAPQPREPVTRPARWLASVQTRLAERISGPGPRRERHVDADSGLTRRMALALGAICFVAATMSHQLTPMIIIATALALAVIARRLPLWIPAGMIVVEVLWLVPAWPYLNARYNLLDFNPLDRPRPTGSIPGLALPGTELVARGAQLTILLLVVLAIAGLVRRARAGHWDVEIVLLVLAPIVVLPLQSYGGEATFRAFLLVLPWLSFLAAWAVLPGPGTRRALRPVRLLAASAAVGTCFLFAYFGLEKINRISSDDVAAQTWVEAHAPTGSLLTYAAPNVPARATAGYARMSLLTSPTSPNLLEDGDAGGKRWGPGELTTLDQLQAAYPAAAHYVVIGPSQEAYLRLYGLVEPGSVEALTAALTAAPEYQLVHRSGDARVFRWLG